MHILTLAHSPDPDDAFMWWPLTGKVTPEGAPLTTPDATPRLNTGDFAFRAVPLDIEVLNRRALAKGDLDITALSFRAWLDVQDRYLITHCGSSFGDGFGPKLIAPTTVTSLEELRRPDVRIAIPGKRTTAFLLLSLILGDVTGLDDPRFVEMPFDQIIGSVARGETDAGMVIHEGQLLFQDAGLHLLIDVGEWWLRQHNLPVPLGCNVIASALEDRYGPGTLARITALLRASIEYALAHREESLEYTMPFALANAAKKGAESSGTPTRERVDRYITMYVSPLTVDMGARGRESLLRLYTAGAARGLCPPLGANGLRIL
jgi:1,4-dihydroxy-6-naphthoate synthase